MFAMQVLAHPVQQSDIAGNMENPVEKFRPVSTDKYVPWTTVKDLGLSKASGGYLQTATDFAKNYAPAANFRVTDNYVGKQGTAHVYLRQTLNGVDIANSDMNLNASHSK